MPEQLLYNDIRKTEDKDKSLPRGDDRHFPFDHVLGPSSAIKEAYFEIVESPDTNSETVLVALSLDEHADQWDFTTDNRGIILITYDDTKGLTVGSYSFAVELIDQTDQHYTPVRGSFEITADIINDSETAPYLSWTTRADLTTDIAALEVEMIQMQTCGNFSELTVAATGGSQATLDVANGAIFTAADNIRLVLDDGTYEDDVVDSVSSNELTLTGTIAGEAAIGNKVRIL